MKNQESGFLKTSTILIKIISQTPKKTKKNHTFALLFSKFQNPLVDIVFINIVK